MVSCPANVFLVWMEFYSCSFLKQAHYNQRLIVNWWEDWNSLTQIRPGAYSRAGSQCQQAGFPRQVLPSPRSQFHHASGRFGAMPAPFAAVRPCQELYLALLHLKVTLFVFSLWHVAPCHAYWGNCTKPSLTLGVFVQKSLATVHSHLLLWVSRGSPSLPNPAGSGPRGELLRNVSWKRSVPSAVQPVLFVYGGKWVEESRREHSPHAGFQANKKRAQLKDLSVAQGEEISDRSHKESILVWVRVCSFLPKATLLMSQGSPRQMGDCPQQDTTALWDTAGGAAGGRAALVEAAKSRSFQQCSEKCDICPYWHFSTNKSAGVTCDSDKL